MTPQQISSFSKLIAACATVLAAVGLLWPTLGAPMTEAVGLSDGEGPAHLWGLWVAAEGLFTHGPFLRVSDVNHPTGFTADLMDPVNLMLFWPFFVLGGSGAGGAVLGWNMVHLLTVVLAGWGGWRLGRAVLESPQGAATVAAAVAGSPYLLGATGIVGRSEYLPMALWALHLSFLLPALKPGPARREQLGAVLTLTALAHGGWQPLTWIVLVELALVWMLCRTRDGEGEPLPTRGTLLRLAVVTVPAALLTVPFLLSHLGTDPWWLGRLGHASPFETRPRAVPLSSLLPLVDVRRSWANTPLPYVGLTLPVMALMGAVALRRKALRWFLLGLAVLVFALGEIIIVGDEQSHSANFYYMPAAILMHIVSPLRAFHGWARLTLLVVPLLALSMGYAVDVAAQKKPSRSLVAAALIAVALVLEGITWAPVGAGSFTIEQDTPLTVSLSALPDGAILELPLGMHQSAADHALLRARALGRATSLAPSPMQPSALSLSAVAWSIEQETALSEHRCASSEAHRLRQAGFSAVVLHTDQLPEDDTTTAAMVGNLLGTPQTVGTTIIWSLPESRRTGVPTGCESLAAEGESLTLKR